MTGALLRTGNLKAFEPLGALGNPVYLAADQLRAAIGRRLGEDAANALAIPHWNQDGDTIDWYAPGPGSVVPWSAATPEEQAQAKQQLLVIQDRIEELGRAMQSEEAGERQVFGRLLAHVTSFPDDGHVYLVSGRPTITFWGFRHQSAPVGSIALLNPALPPEQQPTEEKRRGLSRWWPLPLLLLLALLVIWLLRSCEEPPVQHLREAVEATGTQALDAPAHAPAPPAEPVTRESEEPEPPVGFPRPDLLLREGEGRILDRRKMTSGRTSIPDAALAVDPATGELLENGPTAVEDLDLTRGAEGELEESTGLQEDVSAEAAAEEITPAREEAGDQTLPEEASEEVSELAPPEETPDVAEGAGAERPKDEAPDTVPPELPEPEPVQEPSSSEPAPAESTRSEDATSGQESSDQDPHQQDQPADTALPMPGGKPAPDPAGSKQGGSAPSLKLPPGAVSAGSTRFLNGGWRTSTSLQDPGTGLPIDLEYRLQDGTGNLKLRRSDGSVCSGEVKAVIEDGKLVVHNSRDIKCPDGTNFGRPRLECTPGVDGRADCSGRYETGEVFSVDIKKSER